MIFDRCLPDSAKSPGVAREPGGLEWEGSKVQEKAARGNWFSRNITATWKLLRCR